MEQAAPYLLTPKDRVCRAQSVKYTEGTVRIEPRYFYLSTASSNGIMWRHGKKQYYNCCLDRNYEY